MTDELDDLKRLMEQATPDPDPAKKAAHLALARENFARMQAGRQGTADAARRNSTRPKTGLVKGVMTMISHLSTRGALTATTALVALGVVIALPQLMQNPLPGAFDLGGQTVIEASDETAVANPVAPVAPVVDSRARQQEAAEIATIPTPQPAPEAAPQAESDVQLFSGTPQAQPGAPLGIVTGNGNGNLGYMTAPKMTQQAERRAIGDGLLSHGLSQSGAQKGLRPAPNDMILPAPEANTEAFANADQNPLRITSEDPVSTFSIDVDTASYAVVRSSITRGQLPPSEAVRIEEMINYFPYDYPAPDAGEAPFKPTVTVTPTPWNTGTELVHIAIQGREAATEDRPPLNLVFLIDTSGSMNRPDKLPLLKQSLSLMLSRLTAQDQVAIVTYAGSAGQVLAPTPATERSTILNALEALSAGGSTAGQAGLQQAYSVAEGMAADGEVTRVILATDGDFNVGLSDPEQLKDFIAQKRDSGTYLSVMGFGRGNLDDATMQALAQNGNGQASYIDTLSEAQKVLVDQFSGALFPIANDVKIQVEFNPATVAEYRLIGYETRTLKREDFNNDKVDAGDIGAGHSVTAIYEITPAGSPARLSDPLRYGTTEPAANITTELGYLKLRYKEPGASDGQLIEVPIAPGMGEATGDIRFATAIAGFGELLKHSKFVSDWSFSDAIALATASQGDDPFGYRAEAIRLMRLAESLSR